MNPNYVFPKTKVSKSQNRYDNLQCGGATCVATKYFFGLDLHYSDSILLQLFGSIIETTSLLGSENCTS